MANGSFYSSIMRISKKRQPGTYVTLKDRLTRKSRCLTIDGATPIQVERELEKVIQASSKQADRQPAPSPS